MVRFLGTFDLQPIYSHLPNTAQMSEIVVTRSTLLRTGEYSSRGEQKLVGALEASSYAPTGSFGNTLPFVPAMPPLRYVVKPASNSVGREIYFSSTLDDHGGCPDPARLGS